MLSQFGLVKEIKNPRLENLINQKENFLYAYTGRIYDLGSKEIVPCDNDRYFLLVTICLNNFSDTKIKKLLAHQFSIYPDKAEFLEELKLTVRELVGKIIAQSKADTVLEWIGKNVQDSDSKKNDSKDLSLGKPKTINISIEEEYIQKTHESLQNYFPDQKDQEKLFEVLNGKDISERLTFNGNGIQLATVFKLLVDNKKITPTNKKNTSRWICKNFMYLNDGTACQFNEGKVYDIIVATKYIIKKENRIEIEDLKYKRD